MSRPKGKRDRHAHGSSKLKGGEFAHPRGHARSVDKAANIKGRSRADFMIEAARRAAEEAILDQRVVMVSRESYDHFWAALDRPPEANEKLRNLMRTKAPWDQ